MIGTYNSFQILSASRQIGASGPQPLSLAEIKAYTELFGSDFPIEDWVLYIQALDEVFITHAYSEK